MLYDSDFEGYRTWWKRSKSPARGYFKSYRAVSPIGDVFLVDYNFHENLVRLSLEPASEKGRTYTTTIKRGTIIRERDVFNATNASLRRKFFPFKDIFSCIPDDDVLNSIGGVYDISRISLGKRPQDSSVQSAVESEEVSKPRTSNFSKFSKKVKDVYAEMKIRFVDDLYDSVLGVSLCVAIYLHFFDYVVLGFSLGFMGILFGGLDWILRNRDPFYLKVMSFLTFGGYFFYTGFTRF